MSRFTGKQYRGAARVLKEQRRDEAQARQVAYEALLANDTDGARVYRDKLVRPRLGRRMRQAVSA